MRLSTLIKVVVGLAAVAGLGVLFVRSVKNVASQPYTVERGGLAGWIVRLDPAVATSGVVLALWPPDAFAPPIFKEVFARSGISLSGPNPVFMPLVLQGEFDPASAALTSDGLVQLARESGLESSPPTPRCMASKRVSQPGLTRDVFFVRFEHAPVVEFRRRLAARAGGSFNPESLSPTVIVAASDADFRSWQPLGGSVTEDCIAPIAVQ